MSQRVFRCYAIGTHEGWEAICVDLDIAVQGNSLSDVHDLMGVAIQSYVDDATDEAPEQARRLLRRRAPWYVRLRLAAETAMHILRTRRADDQLSANFDVPCHA
jgi:hypothetical protein